MAVDPPYLHDDHACRGQDPKHWVIEKRGKRGNEQSAPDPRGLVQAFVYGISICRTCCRRQRCLAWAIESGEAERTVNTSTAAIYGGVVFATRKVLYERAREEAFARGVPVHIVSVPRERP